MSYRIVFTDPDLHSFSTEQIARLCECGASFEAKKCRSEEDLLDFCGSADAVITTAAPFTSRVIRSLRRCRVISRTGKGFDNIDVACANEVGIPVTIVPDFCTEDVADHAMALILACTRRIVPLVQAVRTGEWNPDSAMPVHRLARRSLGLVGFGAIGRAVATRAAAFGLAVGYYDPYGGSTSKGEGPQRYDTLAALLAESDIVSLHLPLTDMTRGMIGALQFDQMRPGALLINTARGGLVVEGDLADALAEGKLSGAGLDVLSLEPPAADHPFVAMPNVVVTPHCAAYTVDSLVDLREAVCDEIVRALQGLPPNHAVSVVQDTTRDGHTCRTATAEGDCG